MFVLIYKLEKNRNQLLYIRRTKSLKNKFNLVQCWKNLQFLYVPSTLSVGLAVKLYSVHVIGIVVNGRHQLISYYIYYYYICYYGFKDVTCNMQITSMNRSRFQKYAFEMYI